MALKLALEKFGVGRWVQIVDSGVLPGKLIQQLNGQTQRLMGQQSIAGAAGRLGGKALLRLALSPTRVCAQPCAVAFTGLHVDVDAVRKDNEAKQGPDVVRKSGLIINSGGAPRPARPCDARPTVACRYDGEVETGAAAQGEPAPARFPPFPLLWSSPYSPPRYGLSAAQIAAVVLPDPVHSAAHAVAGSERPAHAAGQRSKQKQVFAPPPPVALTISLLSTPTAGLSRAQRLALLRVLHRRLAARSQPPAGGAAAGPAAAAVEPPVVQPVAPPAPQPAAQPLAQLAAAEVAEEPLGQTQAPPQMPSKAKRAAPAGARKRKAAAAAAPGGGGDDDGPLASLLAMGFSRRKCQDALQETRGNVHAAVDWLFRNAVA